MKVEITKGQKVNHDLAMKAWTSSKEVILGASKENHFSIYGDVDYDTQRDMDAFLKSANKEKVVHVDINSPGGSAQAGLGIYNMLKDYKGEVVTTNYALAASAAAIIALAGDQRLAHDNATMMFHHPWVVMAGNASELREMADKLDAVDEGFVKAISDATEMSDDAIQSVLSKAELVNAKTALDNGYITGILTKENADGDDWTTMDINPEAKIDFGGLL